MAVEVVAQVPSSTQITTHSHEKGAGFEITDGHLIVVDENDWNVAVYAPKIWHSAKQTEPKIE